MNACECERLPRITDNLKAMLAMWEEKKAQADRAADEANAHARHCRAVCDSLTLAVRSLVDYAEEVANPGATSDPEF